MMANPTEYREIMYQALYDGELSDEMQAKIDERRRDDDTPTERGKPLPRKVLSEFEQLQAAAAEARERKAQEAITKGPGPGK